MNGATFDANCYRCEKKAVGRLRDGASTIFFCPAHNPEETEVHPLGTVPALRAEVDRLTKELASARGSLNLLRLGIDEACSLADARRAGREPEGAGPS